MDYKKEIGRRIMSARSRLNMSRNELLNYINMSDGYLGMIERGKRGTSVEHLVEIADILGLSMDYLILGKCNDNCACFLDKLGADENKLLDNIAKILLLNKRHKDKIYTLSKINEYCMEYFGFEESEHD